MKEISKVAKPNQAARSRKKPAFKRTKGENQRNAPKLKEREQKAKNANDAWESLKPKAKNFFKGANANSAYKKKAANAAYMAICEYFLKKVSYSTLYKLLHFYERDLSQPLLAITLKKFLVSFRNNEKYKVNQELKNFFYRLKFCKGVSTIIKTSAEGAEENS